MGVKKSSNEEKYKEVLNYLIKNGETDRKVLYSVFKVSSNFINAFLANATFKIPIYEENGKIGILEK